MTKHRTKESRRYWNDRLHRLLTEYPEMSLVENRYKALKITLQKKYPQVIDSCSPDTMLQLLKDITFLDRSLRRETSGNQTKLKKQLSDQYLVEQDQFI